MPSRSAPFTATAFRYVPLRLAGQGLEFLGWLVMARGLGTEQLGRLSVAFLVSRYVGLIADWGALGRGTRDVASQGRHGSVPKYLKLRTVLSVCLTPLVWLGLGVTSNGDMAAVSVVVLAIGLNRDWIALGMGRGGSAALPGFVQGGIVAVGSTLAMNASGGAWVLAAGYGVGLVLSVALNRGSAVRSTDAGAAGIMAENGQASPYAWLLVASLAIQITSSFDTVIVAALLGPSAAGVYAAVYRFPNAIIAVAGGLASVFLPTATASFHGDPEGHRRLLRNASIASTVGAGIVLLVTPVFVFCVPLLLGPAFAVGQAPLAILMVSTVAILAAAPWHTLLVAAGRDRIYAMIVLTGAVANIILVRSLTPSFALVGAASATLVVQIGLAVAVREAAKHLRNLNDDEAEEAVDGPD